MPYVPRAVAPQVTSPSHGHPPTTTWVPVEPIVMPRSPEEMDMAALAHAGIASSTAAEAAVATAKAKAKAKAARDCKAEAAKAEAQREATAATGAGAKPGEVKKGSPPGPASATPCSRCTAPLTEERQHQPNLVCDGGCGRTFRPGQLRLACGGCDFDLCARCARRCFLCPYVPLPSALCPLPSALCPLPSAHSPLPSAQFLCPASALCPLPSAQWSEEAPSLR